jgi:predicted  nucleic acid-binding Zn-ribbon protein
MKWLTKLLTVEKIDVAPADFSHRIAEIQSRIATLRRRFDQAEKYPNDSQLVPEPKTIENTRETKTAELDALKAKLMGKKK